MSTEPQGLCTSMSQVSSCPPASKHAASPNPSTQGARSPTQHSPPQACFSVLTSCRISFPKPTFHIPSTLILTSQCLSCSHLSPSRFHISLFKKKILKLSWFTVLLISSVQQSDSVTYALILFFRILLHYGLLQDIGHSSLYPKVGPHCSSSLYIKADTC